MLSSCRSRQNPERRYMNNYIAPHSLLMPKTPSALPPSIPLGSLAPERSQPNPIQSGEELDFASFVELSADAKAETSDDKSSVVEEAEQPAVAANLQKEGETSDLLEFGNGTVEQREFFGRSGRARKFSSEDSVQEVVSVFSTRKNSTSEQLFSLTTPPQDLPSGSRLKHHGTFTEIQSKNSTVSRLQTGINIAARSAVSSVPLALMTGSPSEQAAPLSAADIQHEIASPTQIDAGINAPLESHVSFPKGIEPIGQATGPLQSISNNDWSANGGTSTPSPQIDPHEFEAGHPLTAQQVIVPDLNAEIEPESDVKTRSANPFAQHTFTNDVALANGNAPNFKDQQVGRTDLAKITIAKGDPFSASPLDTSHHATRLHATSQLVQTVEKASSPSTTQSHTPALNSAQGAQKGKTVNVTSETGQSLLLQGEVQDVLNWESSRLTPTMHNTAPASRGEFASHVARQMVEVMSQAAHRPTEIALSPEELGRVRLSVQTDDGVITVNIIAERADTLDLMRRHIDQLGQSFRAMGYESITFSFGQGNDTGDQKGNNPGRSKESGELATTATEKSESNLIQLDHAPTAGVDIRL